MNLTLLQWLTLPLLYLSCAVQMGIAAFPAVRGVVAVWDLTRTWPELARWGAVCVAGAAGYFVFGICLMALTAVVARLSFARAKPGKHPYLSLAAVQWALFNTEILLVRFTFINFVRVTPLLPLYYRLLGAKIGRGVQINTGVVADVNLLEIGDRTVIGGDAQIICHVGEAGHLVVAPVKIGKDVTVGLLSVIMPGVEIGDGALVGAHSLVLKNTKIGAGERWGGIPARRLESKN